MPNALNVYHPTSGEEVWGTISLGCWPDLQTAGVQPAQSVGWYVDSNLVGTAMNYPFALEYDTTRIGDGAHTVYAVATLADGSTITSTTITFSTRNERPTIIPAGGLSTLLPRVRFQVDYVNPAGAPTFATLASASGPRRWYRYQEVAGTAPADSSGEAATSALTGTAVTWGQTGPITGEPADKAVLLPAGATQTIPTIASMRNGMDVLVFFKPTANQTLFQMGTRFALTYTHASLKPALTSSGTTITQAGTTPGVVATASAWNWAAVKFGGLSQVPGYIDGVRGREYAVYLNGTVIETGWLGLSTTSDPLDDTATGLTWTVVGGNAIDELLIWEGVDEATMLAIAKAVAGTAPGADVWTDESARLRGFTLEIPGEGLPSTLVADLDNSDRGMEPEYAGQVENAFTNPAFAVDAAGWSHDGTVTAFARVAGGGPPGTSTFGTGTVTALPGGYIYPVTAGLIECEQGNKLTVTAYMGLGGGTRSLSDLYTGKASGPLGAADSGQTWEQAYSSANAQLRIVSGKLVSTTTAASTQAGYIDASIGRPVREIGARFSFAAGSTTADGAIVLVLWKTSITSWPTLPDSPLHLVMWPDGWQLGVFVGQVFTPIASGAFSPALSVTGTVYTASVAIDGQTALIRLPDGTITTVTHPFLAGDANYAGYEIFYNNASTAARPQFVEVWVEPDVTTRIDMQWIAADGTTVVATTAGQTHPIPVSTWTRRKEVFTAPPRAKWGRPILWELAAAGTTMYWGRLAVRYGDLTETDDPYVDGATTGYRWAGTANASQTIGGGPHYPNVVSGRRCRITVGENRVPYPGSTFDEGMAQWSSNDLSSFAVAQADGVLLDYKFGRGIASAASPFMYWNSLGGGLDIVVVPGETINISAYVRRWSRPGTVVVSVNWYTAALAYLTSSTVASANLVNGTWQRRGGPVVVPATATIAIPIIQFLGCVSGDALDVDGLQVVSGEGMQTWMPGTVELFKGDIENYPQEWPSHRRAVVHLKASDMLARLGGTTVKGTFKVQAPADRIGRVLTGVGWKAADRNLDNGMFGLGAETVEETNALQYTNEVARSDGGYLFADGGGRAVYHDGWHRAWRSARSAAPTLLLGDGGEEKGEQTFLAPDLDYDGLAVENIITGTRPGAPALTVVDEASRDKFGPRAASGTVVSHVGLDYELAELLALLVGKRSIPRWRFRSLSIDPRRHPMLFALAVKMQIGDRAMVHRRPQGAPLPQRWACHVEGITHRVQLGERAAWQIDWRLSQP